MKLLLSKVKCGNTVCLWPRGVLVGRVHCILQYETLMQRRSKWSAEAMSQPCIGAWGAFKQLCHEDLRSCAGPDCSQPAPSPACPRPTSAAAKRAAKAPAPAPAQAAAAADTPAPAAGNTAGV